MPAGKKLKSKSGMSTGSILVIAFVLFVAAIACMITVFVSQAQVTLDPNDEHPWARATTSTEVAGTGNETGEDNKPEPSVNPGDIKRKDKFYNILVAGKDLIGNTTDVMMIVSYDVANQKVNILQIPRDSYVKDGKTHRKLNEVFTYAYQAAKSKYSSSDLKKTEIINECKKTGMKRLETVIEEVFAVTIDKFVMVDLSGFKKIVDILGGVEVEVPFDMKYTDAEQGLYINLKKGRQTLNGDQAEQFVRFRNSYVMGDLGRVDAQKIFLSAVAKKLLSPGTITKLPQLMQSAYEYTITNLELEDLTYFGKCAVSLNADSIRLFTAAGEAFRGDYSYYGLYIKENIEIINKAFNCYNVEITKSIMTMEEPSRKSSVPFDTEGRTVSDIISNPPNIKHAW